MKFIVLLITILLFHELTGASEYLWESHRDYNSSTGSGIENISNSTENNTRSYNIGGLLQGYYPFIQVRKGFRGNLILK